MAKQNWGSAVGLSEITMLKVGTTIRSAIIDIDSKDWAFYRAHVRNQLNEALKELEECRQNVRTLLLDVEDEK
jgi:hypothetical protein